MFHLLSLELLHWDYCQRLSLPLDGAIITVAGPNGSGKTTLLDAMRTLLGLECSGGRSYKTYARHANADMVWLRATVDNRPRSRQSSSRPFARSLLYSDVVTLACRIERNGGDWQRRYLAVEGDEPIEQLIHVPEKEWLGIENWRKRLESAGLSRAIARVLALEQGQTDRLCEYSPRDLLRLVFDVFGDQEVLDRYEEARRHQREVAAEVEAARRELDHSRAQLAALEHRVNLLHQYRHRRQEHDDLQSRVIPLLQWSEERQRLTAALLELRRQRQQYAAQWRQQQQDRQQLHTLAEQRDQARAEVERLYTLKAEAQAAFHKARDHERPQAELVKLADELRALAQIEGDHEQLLSRVEALRQERLRLEEDWRTLGRERQQAEHALDALTGQRCAPPPPEVQDFLRTLRQANIAHHLLADVIDITDPAWRAAAEGVLRSVRWVVVLHDPADEGRAFALAERARYRHYVVADAEEAPSHCDPHSLLAVLRFSAPVPAWLLRQLAQIRRVASPEEGVRHGGEWITPNAYWRDSRGGRSVWVDPSQYQFGAAAMATRRQALEAQLARLDAQRQRVHDQRLHVQRQLQAAEDALRGVRAADELVRRADEFEQARRLLPELKQAREAASARLQRLEHDYEAARDRMRQLEAQYEGISKRLQHSESEMRRHEQDWQHRWQDLKARTRASAQQRERLPRPWRAADSLDELRRTYDNAKQAELRAQALQRELAEGHWETDPTVEEKYTLMVASVADQEHVLAQREASNQAAMVAVHNARERYIDVLRSTVRRYRKNVVELGQLAGVDVHVDLPHLDNDDAVLRQAELKVHFNFDGKGHIGLNDGEASGGQQVIKSLILLVGLLKDEDTSGGFVFIDEPFAHLDVRNIQLVGHFLKSTRAQYVLTTPITHNVEVFEPADITLVTAKKPPGARWAPPIGVLQRRARAEG